MSDLEKYCSPNCPFREPLQASDLGPDMEAWRSRRQAHLLGHLIDWKAGEKQDGSSSGISQDGIEDELRYIFNDSTNSKLHEARRLDASVQAESKAEFQGRGPEEWGCFGAEERAEMMAEAIRAYLENPNYIKTAAPKVARRIREAVNTHPVLSPIIQFN